MALALVVTTATLADGIPPRATNCALDAPPAEAGELLTQGVEGRVYPRLSALPRHYGGCQTTWAEAANGWQVVARVYYVDGQPSILQTPPAPSYAGATCHYAHGKLASGPPDGCFPYERLRMKSFPKNCVASFEKTGKAPVACVEDAAP